MRRGSKLILSIIGAALILGAAVGSASATRLEISAQSFRAVWGELNFSGIIHCEVTLEGTFHRRTFTKTSGSLVGYVTRAAVTEGRCRNGTARILAETLPWHVRYDSFTTSLPNIETVKIQLVGAAFLVNTAITGSCLYRTEAGHPARGIITREGAGVATELTAESGSTIPKNSGGGFCPANGQFEGTTTSLTQLGSTSRISIRLI